MKRFTLIALLLTSFALAEGVPEDRSLFWGGRISFLMGGAGNDEPVKGVFSVSSDKMEEFEMFKSGSLGLELGALGWYRLNNLFGFEGEANLRWVFVNLNENIYNRPLNGEFDAANDASLLVWSFDVPVVFRVTPTPDYYLEAGAQFNVNLGGTISSDEESFDFDVEPLGWSLVFGAGALSSNPSKNLLWSAGIRLVIDMTRIEKEGIVEIRKGAAYREASPLNLWNIQLNLAFYF